MRQLLVLALGIMLTCSNCSIAQSIQKNAQYSLLSQRILRKAYVGICIYNPATKKFLYEHDADRYFIPASNTKLYTFYTGLRYIGDSTTGIQYQVMDDTLYIRGTGDPSLLHPDFPEQPAFEFLQRASQPIVFVNPVYENKEFGPGWSLNDYNADYQPERSAMPLYGNVAWFSIRDHRLQVTPAWFAGQGDVRHNSRLRTRSFYVHRDRNENHFQYNSHVRDDSTGQQVPFIVNNGATTALLLADTLHKPVLYEPSKVLPENAWLAVRNVPLDSLFRHMMYRSDNFYAEQTDQMVSLKLFDTISTERVIRYMLYNELRDLPDTPTWADGSGLSRLNLFTPNDIVRILDKLSQEFTAARIDSMLPTGGKGTLSSLYHDMAGSIFAKTGSLRHEVSLSGYLTTQKGHTLIFSILINHCLYPLQSARLAMQRFLHKIWEED